MGSPLYVGGASEKRQPSDLIRHEYNQSYCRKKVRIYNRSNAAMTILDPIGYPIIVDAGESVSGGAPAVAGAYAFGKHGNESSTVALYCDTTIRSISLAANAYVDVNVVVRGPVIVDKVQGIPATDYAGTAFVLATIVAALQALVPPILCGDEDLTFTQTK